MADLKEPNYAAEMKLPEGLTCADCAFGSKCNALFGAVRKGLTTCDFWPRKFIRRSQPPESNNG